MTFTGEGHGQLAGQQLRDRHRGRAAGRPQVARGRHDLRPRPGDRRSRSGGTRCRCRTGSPTSPSMPAVACCCWGPTPTQVFSEMRTTTLSAEDAIAAYTQAFGDAGFDNSTRRRCCPIDDVAQGVYSDSATGRWSVIALGPKAFDDEALQSAKLGCAAEHHGGVVVRRARPRRRAATGAPRSPAPATARTADRSDRGGCSWLVTITPSIMSPTIAAHGRPFSCTATTAPLATRRKRAVDTGDARRATKARARPSRDDAPRDRWCGRRGRSRGRCC